SPFAGGSRNAREWWEDVTAENHEGIRDLGIVLASIVPHSADVERLFSDLGGINTPRRSTMTVANMEKTGKIRSRLSYELYLAAKAKAAGATVHRKHEHMHTQLSPGINAELAKDLENPITWIPPLDGNNDSEDSENTVQKAYQDLERTINDEEPAVLVPGSVINGELVDFNELARMDRGESVIADEYRVNVVGDGDAGGWSVEDLMQS
ncbi:hypothetical protein C8R46DRAFT_885267, partial [Mycena filopes]